MNEKKLFEIPAEVNEAVVRILDYLWNGELEHLKRAVQDNRQCPFDKQIFRSLLVMRRWFERFDAANMYRDEN